MILEWKIRVNLMDTETEDTCLKISGSERVHRDSVLVSLTTETEQSDPVMFFQTGKEQFNGKRFYWQDPAGTLTLAGIGTAAVIQAGSAPDRMARVKEEWSQITRHAIQIGDAAMPATGPLLFGSFSFVPGNTPAELWKNFSGGLFYLPFLMLTVCEGRTFLTVNGFHDQNRPLAAFIRDLENQARKMQQLPVGKTPRPAKLLEEEQQKPEEWGALVRRTVAALKARQMDKVVLARMLRLHFDSQPDAAEVLRRLKKQQNGDFIFCFASSEDYFIGASPERLVRKKGSAIETMCLAGSAARGRTEKDDDRIGEALLKDTKNRREHQYVVTMIKQALSELCRSLSIPDQPVLMKNRDIQHLYTPVSGNVDEDLSVLHFVEKLHPTPALGGLPRGRAVRWITENEPFSRGLYGSPIGWCDRYGNGDFSVGIRSGLIHGTQADLFAGCGILETSVPEQEYRETKAKFRPMLNGLGVRNDEAQ